MRTKQKLKLDNRERKRKNKIKRSRSHVTRHYDIISKSTKCLIVHSFDISSPFAIGLDLINYHLVSLFKISIFHFLQKKKSKEQTQRQWNLNQVDCI